MRTTINRQFVSRASQLFRGDGDVRNIFAGHTSSGERKMVAAPLELDKTTCNRPNGLGRFWMCRRGNHWKTVRRRRPPVTQRRRILRREGGGCRRGVVQTWVGVAGEILGSYV